MKREVIWRVSFAIAAVALLVMVLSNYSPSPLGVWLGALVLVAGLGWWFEIGIEPYGTLNLSPLVSLITVSEYGLHEGLLVAVLAPFSGLLVDRIIGRSRRSVANALSSTGETTVLLGFATLLIGNVGGESWPTIVHIVILSTVVLTLTFFLTAIRLSFSESITLSRVIRPLAFRMVPHLFAMLGALLVVWITFSLIGPIGIALSLIVIVETYYPWKLLSEQRALFLNSLQIISNAVDVKDPYTAHHSRRVADYAVRVARALGVSEDEVEQLRIGALMHDIGKIAVPGRIIRKPSKLADDEMDLMRRHVEFGVGLIEGLDILQRSVDIVRHHHENFDGTGYPSGLAGNEIPIGSRIVFAADAYDAMTTDRPYRKGKSHSEAIAVLLANSHHQFDPTVVDAFKRTVRKPT